MCPDCFKCYCTKWDGIYEWTSKNANCSTNPAYYDDDSQCEFTLVKHCKGGFNIFSF